MLRGCFLLTIVIFLLNAREEWGCVYLGRCDAVFRCVEFSDMVPLVLDQMHVIVYLCGRLSFDTGDLAFVLTEDDLPEKMSMITLAANDDIKALWKANFGRQILIEPFFCDKKEYVCRSLRLITQFLSGLLYLHEPCLLLEKGSFDYAKRQLIYNWDALYSILDFIPTTSTI